MNAFNPPTPWASADHVAGQKPTDKDPFPGAQLKGRLLMDREGTPLLEFDGTEDKVAQLTESAAKQIADAVLNQVSAW